MENQNTQNENQNNPQDNSQSQETSQQGSSQQNNPSQNQNTNQFQQQQNFQGNTGSPADTGKLWGVVGYIFPVLFFIPLVMDDLKTNSYSKFHANQQLVLLIAAIAVNVIGGIIPIVGWFLILPIGSLVLLVIAIIGIINAAKGEMKPLPMIGGFTLIK